MKKEHKLNKLLQKRIHLHLSLLIKNYNKINYKEGVIVKNQDVLKNIVNVIITE